MVNGEWLTEIYGFRVSRKLHGFLFINVISRVKLFAMQDKKSVESV